MLEKRKPKKNCGRKTNVKRVAKNAKKQNSGAPFISNENDELQSVEEEGKIFLIWKIYILVFIIHTYFKIIELEEVEEMEDIVNNDDDDVASDEMVETDTLIGEVESEEIEGEIFLIKKYL